MYMGYAPDESYLILLKNRSLTIGQMQGKFQMVVVRHTGHAIQVISVMIHGILPCSSDFH